MNHFEIYQNTFFPQQCLSSEQTIEPDPALMGLYQGLTDLGEGKYPTPASSGHSVLPKVMRKE